jgi:Cu-processing system permease protein
MNAIWSIAKVTVIEQIRNRLYLVILFFGAVILASSLLLGTIAPGHKTRVILDIGLLTIELFGLAAAVFGAVNLVLQEIESKTIYLLLTRPLPRSFYIIGRFVGLVTAVAITMFLMAVLHVLAMLSDPQAFREFAWNIPFWQHYPVLVFMTMSKMLITCAMAIFFSLFATSSVSALTFTGFFWMAGHFASEINFLIEKSQSVLTQIAGRVISFVIPNYQIMNFRDAYHSAAFDPIHILWALGYALGYTCLFLIFSSVLFSRKEF